MFAHIMSPPTGGHSTQRSTAPICGHRARWRRSARRSRTAGAACRHPCRCARGPDARDRCRRPDGPRVRPKRRAKATCSAREKCWSRRNSTLYFSSSARISANSASSRDASPRSTPESSAPIAAGQRIDCDRGRVCHGSRLWLACWRSDRRGRGALGRELADELFGARPFAEARGRDSGGRLRRGRRSGCPTRARAAATRSKRASGSLRLAATMLGNGSGARGTGSQPFARSASIVG